MIKKNECMLIADSVGGVVVSAAVAAAAAAADKLIISCN